MSAKTLSGSRGSERLRDRRLKRRRRIVIISCIVLAIIIGEAIYQLHQPFARITRIQVFGADPSLSETVLGAMQGRYLGIIPRDSTFFYPEDKVRAAVLATNPDIAAVSFFRNGLNGLSVRVDMRVPIAQWCGLAPTPGVEEYCYVFDASGLIYASHASTTQTLNKTKLYAPLVGESIEPPVVSNVEPLRSTIAHAERLPSLFDFTRQIGTLGTQVVTARIRESEVDMIVVSGTRITYVLGEEKTAYQALVSALGSGNLLDGSVEYIDLRFGSKVYVKRKGDASVQ